MGVPLVVVHPRQTRGNEENAKKLLSRCEGGKARHLRWIPLRYSFLYIIVVISVVYDIDHTAYPQYACRSGVITHHHHAQIPFSIEIVELILETEERRQSSRARYDFSKRHETLQQPADHNDTRHATLVHPSDDRPSHYLLSPFISVPRVNSRAFLLCSPCLYTAAFAELSKNEQEKCQTPSVESDLFSLAPSFMPE